MKYLKILNRDANQNFATEYILFDDQFSVKIHTIYYQVKKLFFTRSYFFDVHVLIDHEAEMVFIDNGRWGTTGRPKDNQIALYDSSSDRSEIVRLYEEAGYEVDFVMFIDIDE